METPNTTTENQKHISEFMLSEYEHISEAHFESGKSITSFFRYYLLVMSTPAFILLLFDKNLTSIAQLVKGEEIGFNKFILFFFCVVAIIGFCILLYIIDKKMEAILYARTVNGIRNYFKMNSVLDVTPYLVLPTDIKKPSYFDWSAVFSIILPIGIINSSLVFFGFWVIKEQSLSIYVSAIFLIIHISTYTIISLSRSNTVR